MLALMISVTY